MSRRGEDDGDEADSVFNENIDLSISKSKKKKNKRTNNISNNCGNVIMNNSINRYNNNIITNNKSCSNNNNSNNNNSNIYNDTNDNNNNINITTTITTTNSNNSNSNSNNNNNNDHVISIDENNTQNSLSHICRVNWQITSSSFNIESAHSSSDEQEIDHKPQNVKFASYAHNPPARSYRCTTNLAAIEQLNQSHINNSTTRELDHSDDDEFTRWERAISSSLFIFSEENTVRRFCRKITGNKIFEYFMLLTIVANCIVLSIGTPLPNNDTSSLNQQLDESDKIFVAIFIVEVVLRVIASGFVIGSDTYLKSGWNILDFIVAIVGAVYILTTMDGASPKQAEIVKALRAVRVLRPLKLVSGVPSLQVLMKSLVRAMVPLLQILLLVLFVIIIYSIIGLELLRGEFHYTCFNATTGQLMVPISLLKTRPCDHNNGWGKLCNHGEVCRRAKPSEWAGPKDGITTFDNIFLSMLTIFQCITLEGWSDILYLTMDSKDQKVPIISWSAFILLIIVGSFFMLNLVLGVLSGEFAKERERVENRKSFLKLRKTRQVERHVEHYLHWIRKAEEISLDEFDQQNMGIDGANNRSNCCHDSNKTALSMQRSKAATKERKPLHVYVRQVTKSKIFYWLVLLLVFLNTVTMSLTCYNQSPYMRNLLDSLELTFTVLFFIEMLLRVFGWGVRDYFHSAFNKYDFVVVWLSIGDLTYKSIQQTSSIGISVLRSLRLLRIFKVTRFWSSMQNVISSLMNSMRSILSLILLLLLFIFIFALLGMQLFGGQFPRTNKTTSRTNFDNFINAMLAVFQIMSGEDWNTVMYHGIKAYGGPKSLGGMLVSLYFIALVIVGNYTLLNVFLAIAVDNLANAQVLTRDEEEEKRKAEEQKKMRSILFSPKMQHLKNTSKWKKVRAMPKMLAFTNRQKNQENPFKGVTYQSRPHAFFRAQSEPDGNLSSPEPACDRLHAAVLQAHSKHKSLDLPARNHNARRARLVSQQSFDASTPKHSLRVIPPSWMRSFDSSSVTVNENAAVEENLNKPSEVRNNLPIGLLPVPGSVIEIPGSSKVLRRRQLTTTKVINTRSLFLFPPSSRIRTWCHYVVNLKHFERFMLGIIILSTLCLAIENPLDINAVQNKVIYYLDVVFVALFTFEITIKIIDQGAVVHKGSYLRDWWNVIDTIIVFCNIAATALDQNKDVKVGIGQSILQAMRIMRVFRSLRVVNKIKELKLVCQCVVFSLKRTFNIIIVIVLCLFMFAVIGVNLFQGKFRYCTDLTKMTEEECQGNYFYSDNPIGDPNLVKVARRVWKNSNFHFDNVLFAFLTLFSCGTGEGWPIIMEKSIDATTVDHGPILNNNMFMSLYYVTFVVVYSFFFLNIFVALIIVTFQEQGEKEMTGSELDKNQRACLQFVLNAKPRQRFMPKDVSGFSFKVWRVVDSKPFEIIIMVLIALNAIGLMLSFDEQSEGYGIMLDNINLAFTFIFTLEAMLKLMAYKFNYFRDSWNVLDFVIVFITLVGAIIKITSQDFPIALSFFRLFRAFRLLKLLRQGYNIRILLWTFLQSLKGLPYVVLLIIMMFFIYAVIGMQLFSKIAFNDKKKINEYNHFQTFISSLGVLFRCGTGEAWHLVMLDCFDDAPCYNDVTMTCGSTVTSVIYFVTFYFLYAFLLLNLFVAVIMDNFDYLTRDESILGPHHMDEFVRVWSEYDPSAAGRIPHGEIYQLMCDMQPPVGFGKKCPKYLAYKRLMKLNMPISGDNTVLFTPTLFALVRTSLNMTSNENECFRDSSFRKIIKRIWPNTTQKTLDLLMPEHTVLSGQQITIGKIYAAKRIYESFQEIRRRRNCILPQFEEFEASNHHKRGNSLLRKIKGVLRTSSHPLSSEKVQTTRPRDDFMLKRKRSNTSGSHPELYGKNEASRVRSASHLATKLNDPMGKSRQRRSSKQMMFQSAPSINIVDASPTEEIATVVRNHSPVTEQNSEGEQALTNSLITALRDPAKPILCFVNPQLHRVEHRVEGSNRIPGDTEDNRDHNNGDRRPSNSRGRQRHVMVSLPMIKLEIPVDRDSDFVDLATDGGNNNRNNIRRRSNSNLEHSDNMMPDLLKSLRNTSVPAVEPSTDQLSSDESGSSPSSIRSDRSQHSEDHGGGSDNERRDSDESCNRDILRELNDQLNIAISEGVQPTWLYKITEDEGDTWC